MSDRNELALAISDPVKLRSQLLEFNLEDLLFLRSQIRWKGNARRKQLPPENNEWNFFGLQSGRGFGKTLSAAQWLYKMAWKDPGSYNFVISPTYDDVRYTCFQGPTGLFSVIPEKLIYDSNLTLPSITLINGSIIRGFAADAPERLRGPQCNRAWCDEVASWRYPKDCWDNLIMGLRLGSHPQVFWTGTPKPKPFIRELIKLPGSVVRRGSTYENKDNLTSVFYDNVAKYEGTKIGRQEIYGELIDPEESGFVKRSDWRLWPARKALPRFRFILMSLDTAFTEETFDKKEQENDPTACTVWGLFTHERNDHIMLLDAWEDYLGLPALIKRVKKEREYSYGDSDEPVLRPIVPGVHRPKHQGRPPDLIIIEDKGSGISLRQSLAVEKIMTYPYNPGQADKLSRLHTVSPLFPNRRVWAIESDKREGEPRSWAEPVLSQVCSYVGRGSLEHDDLLDTSTQALKYLMDKFSISFGKVATLEEDRAAALERIKQTQRKNPYD